MIDDAISFCLKNPASVVYLIGKRNYLPMGERRMSFANGSVLYTAKRADTLRKAYTDCIFFDSEDPLPDFLRSLCSKNRALK
jgi:hypothetical protein